MKRDNNGYSLVEMIIVVAILMIVTSAVFLSINMIFAANAKTCANDLKSAISQCKINTMGKSDAVLEIYRDPGNQCIYARQHIKDGSDWQHKEAEKISNAKVYITYTTDGTNFTELDDTKSIFISFDRSSGSFKKGKDPDTDIEDPIYSGFFVGGGRRKYEIELVELTGKVIIKAGADK